MNDNFCRGLLSKFLQKRKIKLTKLLIFSKKHVLKLSISDNISSRVWHSLIKGSLKITLTVPERIRWIFIKTWSLKICEYILKTLFSDTGGWEDEGYSVRDQGLPPRPPSSRSRDKSPRSNTPSSGASEKSPRSNTPSSGHHSAGSKLSSSSIQSQVRFKSLNVLIFLFFVG